MITDDRKGREMRRTASGVAVGAVVWAVLSGCSAGEAERDPAAGRGEGPSASAPAGAKGGSAEVAKSAGTVGPDGSACELPVAFDVAKGWKAEAVQGAEALGEDVPEEMEGLEELFRQGPVAAACEVDAKGAGHIGFLRVWTGDPSDDDATAVLKEFVAAETEGSEKAEYGTFTAEDGLEAATVSYMTTSALWEKLVPQRALAVVTPGGPVVLHLGGSDEEEHKAMLPAYELARTTLRTT
ncbi:lipoprotein [Streptomyces sp. NPDC002734]|uniref:lipoprotein n=1 Tax=Streptomyces sp. NPDC002734 TaxID=3154426 RepID=UPI003326744B